MKRQETTNTFQEGMIMDLDPLTTPNNVVTNCLNGTLLTFNGNEYVLQNDMGNGRVETAYLPEGYVPLGTTELGGIIYIVSYNPLNGRCQIGSFPSPERNIESDKDKSPIVTLSNSDFGYEAKENNNFQAASIYYLKKSLDSKTTYNPGDKFIVCGDQGLKQNRKRIHGIYNALINLKEETVKLSIGTITSDGKVIKLKNLKKFDLGDGEQYEIYSSEITNIEESDLDEYRSLVTSPYNIFNEKISGQLIIIAELLQFEQFNVEIQHKLNNDKKYTPSVDFIFKGQENEFLPYKVQCKFTLITGDKDIGDNGNIQYSTTYDCQSYQNYQEGTVGENVYVETFNNFLQESKIQEYLDDKDKYDFNQLSRKELILEYTFTPCMNWGPVQHLTISGQIDLSKINTGFIKLNSWKYFNNEKECNLIWGLNAYPEDNYKIHKVKFELTRYYNPQRTKHAVYNIDYKTSYHGTSQEVIPLNQEYYQFEKKDNLLDTQLISNNLYLVAIKIYYGEKSISPDDIEPKCFYRWLYTNEIFNKEYTNTSDFLDLRPEFDIIANIRSETSHTDNTQEKLGVITKESEVVDEITEEDISSKSSISAIQTFKNITANCTADIILKKDYNSFRLKFVDNNSIKIDVDTENSQLQVNSSIRYSGESDCNQDTYLQNIILSNWEGEEPLLNDKTSAEDLIKSDTYGNGLYIKPKNIQPTYNNSTNNFSFKIDFNLLELAKAYCSKKIIEHNYSGKFTPLCYNRQTFKKYNLYYNSKHKKWVPNKIGTFAFHENRNSKGHAFIGSITKNQDIVDFNQTEYKKQDGVSIDFASETALIEYEKKHLWDSSIMFVAHFGDKGGKENQFQVFNSNMQLNLTWENFDLTINRGLHNVKEIVFSQDPVYTTSYQPNKNPGHLVILMMQSSANDGFYYPINYCLTSNIASNKDEYGYYHYDLDNYFKPERFYSDLYHSFAQFLNNCYRYDKTSIKTHLLIPNSIYWIDEYKYTIKIPFDISNKSEDIQIKLEDELENKFFLSIQAFNNLTTNLEGVSAKEKESLKLNITPKINNQINSNLIIYDYSNDSIKLKTKMENVDRSTTTVIYDYNGKDIINRISDISSYTQSDVYFRLDKDISESNQFLARIEYDNDGQAIKENGLFMLTTQKLNQLFQINEKGQLVLDKNKLVTSLSFNRRGINEGSGGTIRGYQGISIFGNYKAWLDGY